MRSQAQDCWRISDAIIDVRNPRDLSARHPHLVVMDLDQDACYRAGLNRAVAGVLIEIHDHKMGMSGG